MENRNVFNLVFEKTGVLWTLVLSVILSPFAANAIQHTSAVPIQSGEIRGFVATLSGGDQVTKYLGIPYAKAARFENPGPPTNWTGVKDMVTTGKACRQVIYKPYTHFTGVETIQDMSEDCLNLNVYVPHNSSNLTLPVMVWIHEGTFVYGSNRLYDGSIIATNGKVIVVSINFRLGVFGFLATGNTAKDLKGNYGLFDQVQALKWVQENIDKFGGDPNKVTIFGNTVGGASVSLLCLSPLANGLFQNAIMQSGASNAPWAVYSYKDSHKKIRAFAKNVGCRNVRTLKSCLKRKTADQIMNSCLQTPCYGFAVVDGDFLTDTPSVLLEGGNFDQTRNLLLGVTNDDGSWTTNAIPELSGVINATNGVERNEFKRELTSGYFSDMITQTTPANKDAVLNAIIYYYTDWRNVTDRFRNRRMLVNLMTDCLMTAPAIAHANAFAKSNAKTYFYHLEYRVRQGLGGHFSAAPSWMRVYHQAEKLVVFGFPLNVSSNLLYTKDANFSRGVIQMWTNFARNGNPNNPGSVTWPEYDTVQQQYLVLKPNLEVKTKLRADHMAFWNTFLPKFKSALPTCEKATPAPNKKKTGGHGNKNDFIVSY